MIKSPYNFVPLNKRVFFPDWADQVSHDVPFSDGESGIIEVKIRAESPLYVRNGNTDKEDSSFSHSNGKYYIPGTSVKGMVRSVLEILSYGKMQQVDDRRFSWRDLKPSSTYLDHFTSGINARPLVKAGFVRKENGKYTLTPCEYARIEQCELDPDFGSKKNILSSAEKYKLWVETKGQGIKQTFNISDRPSTEEFTKQCGSHYRAKIDPKGNKKGQLVFTGQIGPRNKGGEGLHGKGKKHLEFVFFDEKRESLSIDEQMWRDFDLNHRMTHNTDNHSHSLAPNEEWDYWKKKMANGDRMPVFWLETKDSKEVSSLGLSMLYRLPLKFTVHDQIRVSSPDHVAHIKEGKVIEEAFRSDLAETIFGYAVKNKALKGRVQFSHAFALGSPKVLAEKSAVLSSPKATFYPNYLQSGTYDDKKEIKGRKRYPVHNGIGSTVNEAENDKMETKFIPLDRGSEFVLKIHYHNLREVELGALLSALTFHNSKDCFHSIGMAKPLGYGKITLSIETETIRDQLTGYLRKFEKQMHLSLHDSSDKKLKNIWAEGLGELVTMASDQNGSDENLQYMALNDFGTAKNNQEHLSYYSKQNGVEAQRIHTFFSDDELSQLFMAQDKEKQEKKEAERRTAEEKKKQERERLEAKKKAKSDATKIENEQRRKQKEEESRKKKEARERDLSKKGFDSILKRDKMHGLISGAKQYVSGKKEGLSDGEKVSLKDRIREINNHSSKKDDLSKSTKATKKIFSGIKELIGEELTNILRGELGGKG